MNYLFIVELVLFSLKTRHKFVSDISCLKMPASGSPDPRVVITENVDYILPESDQEASAIQPLDEMPVALEIVNEHYKTYWLVFR